MARDVVALLRSDQYTGSNGAALVAQFGGSVVNDDGTTLDFLGPDANLYSLTAGRWVLWTTTPNPQLFMLEVPTSTYNLQFVDLTANTVGLLVSGGGGYTPPAAPALVQASGSAAVPASLLGQTANYDVTMSPALPDDSFKPIAQLRGAPGIISGHGILSVTVIDADTVRVQINSAAASLAGGSVVVTAFALA